MSVILILILASLAVAVAFLACFIWAVRAGQFEDTCTPAMRILSEDKAAAPSVGRKGPPRSPLTEGNGRLSEASQPGVTPIK
jgi:cbb3-type cytochrome oxidase maturation protein